jgi:uncharacterized protein YegJ (DUF2314 family)
MFLRRLLIAGVCVGAACVGAASSTAAQSTVEKAKRDEIFKIAKGDPVMAEAMRKARATLSEFLALADNPRPGAKNFSVKIGLPAGDDREFVWIRPFARKGGTFTGRLVNTPRTVSGLRYGDTLTFAERDIVDWSYLDDDNMKGNYTACALLTKESPRDRDEFMKRYRLRCDF